MIPAAELRPGVLPTERLHADGRPKGPLRDELRVIPAGRNAITVAAAWGQIVAVTAGAVLIDHPVAWVAAVLLQGRAFALLLILGHEAAHRLLFPNRRVNDLVGRWLLGYPAFNPIDTYRRGHMAHHRDALGPAEPDKGLYAGYPISTASLGRKLARDAFGNSGWKNLKPLLVALAKPSARPVALRIVAAQLVLLGVATAFGRPELYLFLWFLPWMTVWRVLNRLRAIAEHGGMTASADHRLTTHHVRQSWPARFWIVPYNTGWHLAHHVDPGVPFRNLPRLQRELDQAGWSKPGLRWRGYWSLWRALASRPPHPRECPITPT